ncbi:MAG: N-acetylmuramic acid 6-phosphate etherase [Alphaproteobacteria bacterium]
MTTETASDRYRGMDAWPGEKILDAMLDGQQTAVAAVRPALPAMEAAASAAVPRLRRGGRLVYAGAGTSGRIALQDGVELAPTFGWPTDRVVYLLAGGEGALIDSVEGAEDDRGAAAAAVDAAAVGPDDVVLGLAASGTTPYTVAAIERSRRRGALTVGVANNAGAPLLAAAEHPVLLDTGAEVIAGSTRMKAGTAQKAMLNLFSSLVMVKLGRVHDGYMVDVVATNAKLVRRGEAMLMEMTGADEAAARAALARSNGHVKTAVLVLRGLTPDAAAAALERADGSLRGALADLS